LKECEILLNFISDIIIATSQGLLTVMNVTPYNMNFTFTFNFKNSATFVEGSANRYSTGTVEKPSGTNVLVSRYILLTHQL